MTDINYVSEQILRVSSQKKDMTPIKDFMVCIRFKRFNILYKWIGRIRVKELEERK